MLESLIPHTYLKMGVSELLKKGGVVLLKFEFYGQKIVGGTFLFDIFI